MELRIFLFNFLMYINLIEAPFLFIHVTNKDNLTEQKITYYSIRL